MLVSNGEKVIQRAIEDLEYHAEVLRVMGFDSSDNEQAINIHGGAKRPHFESEFRQNFARLASDTQRWLSVENDEFSYGLDDLLPLADTVKICVDINHYWIHQGEYLDHVDPRLDHVVSSWRGARPKMHVAWPHETVLQGHDPLVAPHMNSLLAQGLKKSKMRAHSQLPWNQAVSLMALKFWPRFDLMTESKAKNITAAALLALSQENL
jgi:UV DNA damage repair endonuclease